MQTVDLRSMQAECRCAPASHGKLIYCKDLTAFPRTPDHRFDRADAYFRGL